jgi:colicin import membrane protein
LRQLQNNELRKLPSEKSKGFVGTALVHAGALFLMLLIGLSIPPEPPEEEGIIINFGTDLTGMGFVEPSPAPPQEDVATPPPPPPAEDIQPEAVQATEEKPLLTQDTEEAPEVKKVDPDAERKRQEQIEAERKRREELEAERIRKEQEELERQRIAAEQAKIEADRKRQEEIINRTRNALADAKNSGTDATSEGVAGGEGNQGSTGSVDSQNRGEASGLGNNGISYSLAGRGVQRLPLPKYDYQGEGKVVVEVSVDRSGKVTQAVAGTKGSNTLDEYLLRVAREAALEARFDPKDDAPVIQKGTITYNFVLK